MNKHIPGRAVLFAAIFASAAFVTLPDSGAPALGPFTATVSGAVSTQFSGDATSMGRVADAWNAALQSPSGEGTILLGNDTAGRPAPGTYRIADMEEHGGSPPAGQFTALVAMAGADMATPVGFGSVDGTLIIDASSPTAVTGSFNFLAVDAADSTRTVTVDGTFTTANEEIS